MVTTERHRPVEQGRARGWRDDPAWQGFFLLRARTQMRELSNVLRN